MNADRAPQLKRSVMSLHLAKSRRIGIMKEYKGKPAIFLLALTLLFVCLLDLSEKTYAQTTSSEQKSYQFVNGQWFDGKNFRRRTFFSVDGVLTRKKPAKVNEIIDLENGFIIPPFADAHSHKLNIKSELAEQESRFVKEGTMYVMVLNNGANNTAANRRLFNKPGAVDVLFANGGITRTGQHPAFAYERNDSGIAEWWLPENTKIILSARKEENNSYWFFDTIDDVDKNGTLISLLNPTSLKFICLM